MKTVWTKGLTPQAKEEMKREFDASAALRRRLAIILQEKQETSYKESASKDAYNSPNWTYLQADARGFERALAEIQSLLEN